MSLGKQVRKCISASCQELVMKTCIFVGRRRLGALRRIFTLLGKVRRAQFCKYLTLNVSLPNALQERDYEKGDREHHPKYAERKLESLQILWTW